MIPTVENFAEMLREEVHTLRVMYRLGCLMEGYTDWGCWIEGSIEHVTESRHPELAHECFRIVVKDKTLSDGDPDYPIGTGGFDNIWMLDWSYVNRKHRVEQTYQENFEDAYAFGTSVPYGHEPPCIQIVFMDARKQHRRATRNIKGS